MDKTRDALRTIGEMAKQLGVKTHILRYWEEHFPMLQPLKRAGGRRHYRPEDVLLLQTVHRLLNQEGYTIKGARQFLASARHTIPGAEQSSGAISSSPPSFPVGGLRAIRDRLQSALDAA